MSGEFLLTFIKLHSNDEAGMDMMALAISNLRAGDFPLTLSYRICGWSGYQSLLSAQAWSQSHTSYPCRDFPVFESLQN